nr:RNA-directed DNA polymerase, eukaryota [Tanacetum cinerariifolium]
MGSYRSKEDEIEDLHVGKRFVFVRFIKVLDVNRLVNNICTVWVGRHKLQANISRFQREPLKRHSSLHNIDGVKGGNSGDTYNSNGMKGAANSYARVVKGSQNSKMDLDSSPVMIQLASSDFNTDGRVTWVEIEGIPLKMWSKNTFNRVASKWGVLLDVYDQEDEHFHRKRICINTNVPTNILESFKLIYRAKVFWVRAKEVPGWIPDFVEDNDEEEDSKVSSYEEVPNREDVKNVEDLEGDSDGEIVPDTKFEEDFPNQKGKEDSVGQGNVQSEDPFNIYELLNHKRSVIDKNSKSKESLKYPPGYTPTGSHFKKSEIPKSGGSILQLIDDLVKVGETMGASVGNSGGILCVWDPNMFKKTNSTISDYFVIVRGDWMPNGKKLLIISVYAPQELSEKKMLWDYLSLVMSKWEGEVVIMGDFNKVRNKSERFGTLFNRHGADVFNHFISNAGLEDVPLEGCSFTWCHRSATKMSKLDRFLISDSLLCSCPNISSITLDRYLFDHRPILMREVYYDYGLMPFRFLHYWFEVDGFDKFIEDSWKDAPIIESNALVRMMKKLNIRGILVEGTWIDSPSLVKSIELVPSLNISHMFYADDAIFMGQWSESNIDTIVKVLDCFNRASGLRINMSKSELLGIYMEDDKSWNETIERTACRLSKWKLKTLSIGVIIKWLVNISKRRAFWSLNKDILKIDDSDYQYAVSIKEDMTHLCLHSPKSTKERSSIHRIQRSSIRRIQDIIELLVADIMKALKESKKLSRSQPHARGSSEGTGTKILVLDGSMVILTLSSEETEKKDDADDDKSIDLKNTDNEETDDEVVHSDEYVNDDVHEEMYDAEDVYIGKSDEEMD